MYTVFFHVKAYYCIVQSVCLKLYNIHSFFWDYNVNHGDSLLQYIPHCCSLEQRCKEKREEIRILSGKMEKLKREEEAALYASPFVLFGSLLPLTPTVIWVSSITCLFLSMSNMPFVLFFLFSLHLSFNCDRYYINV